MSRLKANSSNAEDDMFTCFAFVCRVNAIKLLALRVFVMT